MRKVDQSTMTTIRDGISAKKTLRAIAKEAGVSPGYVAQVKNGRDRAGEKARRQSKNSERAAAAPEVDRQLQTELAGIIDQQIEVADKFVTWFGKYSTT